ncbi:GNAT family N-acetyltransferase [Paenibacillus sp. Mc5Re-14]|uniref:GNAT family N-acetyltransferase n=1 Tax=Paenibacillus sp. Mc5Re-14 TaxID=1030529 RepID=UPI000ABDEA0F|nr:GNAT family N-acetyltransferase [Paenibacillus sp. Mc5Re-14]
MSGFIKLVPMNAEQYERFEQRSLADYAEEKIQAGAWTVEEAPERAKESFATFLPQRLDTPHAHLYMLEYSGSGGQGPEEAGYIWFNITESAQGKEAFLLDILVYDSYQGQGLGTLTMQALEQEARRLGAVRIGLHVFGHNERALHVYRKSGYRVTDIQMSKEI